MKSQGQGVSEELKPFVSLCTVTYNRRHFLPLLQWCILQQDYPRERMQWVILDDSDDGSPPFEPDSRLNVVYKQYSEKIPLGRKRNLSHQYCDGEIIVYLDDDDFYPPSRVSYAVQSLQDSEELIAGCTLLPILFLPEEEIAMVGPFGKNHATAGTFAFRRELLQQTAFQDDAKSAEERYFLKNYAIPLKQLDPKKTILCIAHRRNTFDKRQLKHPHNPRFKQLKDQSLDQIRPLIKRYEEASRRDQALQRMPMLRVIITAYNEADFIVNCLRSIQSQHNCRFTVDVMDDASDDSTYDVAVAACSHDQRCRVHRLEVNQGPLGAFAAAIECLEADDEDVIVWVDADDQLAASDVLSIVAATYAATDCWLTYGSFVNSRKQQCGRPYEQRVIFSNAFRRAPWLASHLKTFKIALWRQLQKSDLQTAEGSWFRAAVDLAVMFPLLEMAGPRQQFIPDVLYLYNSDHASSISNTKRELQHREGTELRARPSRQRLRSLPITTGSLMRE